MAGIDLVFSVIHQREVTFLVRVAEALHRQGFRVGLIAFHEAAGRMVRQAGVSVASVHELRRMRAVPEERRAALGALEAPDPLLPDLASRVRHERLVFNRPEERLIEKALEYEAILTDVLAAWGRPAVVQELSGFIGPLALYVTARRLGLRHFFLEPAMFAGRLVFTESGLEARLDPQQDVSESDIEAARAYVADYLARRLVLIPAKDRHFFVDMTARAVLNLDNVRKLARKLAHKYMLGIGEEYDAIGEYVRRHLLRLVRRRWLARFYEGPVVGERFVYFPFHVPLDVQLTLRSPEYLDQEAFARRLAQSLPAGVWLYVKEHPASIGAHSLSALRQLLATGRVRLIHPSVNSFELIRDAAVVVTINSKVGAEALMQSKPLVVVGRAFYRGHGVSVDVEQREDLGGAVAAAAARPPDEDVLNRFLGRVWAWTRPGELFDADPINVAAFVASVRAALGRERLLPQPGQPTGAGAAGTACRPL